MQYNLLKIASMVKTSKLPGVSPMLYKLPTYMSAKVRSTMPAVKNWFMNPNGPKMQRSIDSFLTKNPDGTRQFDRDLFSWRKYNDLYQRYVDKAFRVNQRYDKAWHAYDENGDLIPGHKPIRPSQKLKARLKAGISRAADAEQAAFDRAMDQGTYKTGRGAALAMASMGAFQALAGGLNSAHYDTQPVFGTIRDWGNKLGDKLYPFNGSAPATALNVAR